MFILGMPNAKPISDLPLHDYLFAVELWSRFNVTDTRGNATTFILVHIKYIFGSNFVIFEYCYVKYRRHFFVAGENFANKLFIRSAKLTEIRSAKVSHFEKDDPVGTLYNILVCRNKGCSLTKYSVTSSIFQQQLNYDQIRSISPG